LLPQFDANAHARDPLRERENKFNPTNLLPVLSHLLLVYLTIKSVICWFLSYYIVSLFKLRMSMHAHNVQNTQMWKTE